MSYLNLIGLILMIFIMIPNIIYAVKYKGKLRKLPQTKLWKMFEVFEQIGRYGCFICMIFKIPGIWVGFFSMNLFLVYLSVDFILVFVYLIIWIFWFKKNNLFRAVALSLLPSFVFLFSGLLSRYFILSIFALIFGTCHVAISVKLCDDFDFSNYGKRY